MSDQGPTDPTRPNQPVGGEPADEPTSVIRESTTRTGPPRDRIPTEPPRSGGVSTGVAIGAALAVGLLGLLIGFLLFNDDGDTDVADDTDPIDDTVPLDDAVDSEVAELEAERDELADRVAELEAENEDLQAELDEVTEERDELQAQLEQAQEGGDGVETVEAVDVVGGTADDARVVAQENGWTLVVVDAADAGGAEPGTVVEQIPAAGTPMIEGSVLVVEVAPEPSE